MAPALKGSQGMKRYSVCEAHSTGFSGGFTAESKVGSGPRDMSVSWEGGGIGPNIKYKSLII